MHAVETLSHSGEDEGADEESPMKAAFRNQPHIYSKLTQIGITDLEQVVGLNDEELDELCGSEAMNLNVVNRLKFKSKVRVLQQDRAAKQPVPIVAVSIKEQKDLQRLNIATKTANRLESVFGQYLKQIDKAAETMKASVNEEADKICNAVNMWKNAKCVQVCYWVFIHGSILPLDAIHFRTSSTLYALKNRLIRGAQRKLNL